jgi:hypothetical protein
MHLQSDVSIHLPSPLFKDLIISDLQGLTASYRATAFTQGSRASDSILQYRPSYLLAVIWQ